MIERNDKVFKGVWIPVEIWNADSLSWMEKCLWAEISSLGNEEKPCFASNTYLAGIFHSTESSISNMISKLKSLKMIKHISYDGRSRKMLAIIPTETSPTSELRLHPQVNSDFTHRLSIDTRGDTKGEVTPIIPLLDVKKKSRKPKLVNDSFISELKKLNPTKDIDAQVIAAKNWLLAHPPRQFTQPFFSSWINRTKPTINPEEIWKPTTI
jgi:hypothetical protein